MFANLRSGFDRQPWLTRRAVWDFIQLVVLVPGVIYAAIAVDTIYQSSGAIVASTGALSELIVALTVVGVFLIVFMIRRLRDISREVQRQQAREARASALARRDPLTGMCNRRHLNEAMAEQIMAADHDGQGFALLLLDLDRFKPVNDLFGHSAGDLVLKRVGQRLAMAAPEATSVARIGGDEFAILVPCNTQEGEAGQLADSILGQFEKPIDVQGKAVRIGASVGIALYPSGGDDAEALFRHADVALYNAKRQGRNRYCLYAGAMEDNARTTTELGLDIKRGIQDSEFVPYFQPLVDLRSGRIVGMEVLARWHHPLHGLLRPDRFIHVAETVNVIADLTFQVMRKACILAREWDNELFLTLNISQSQLRDQWLPERILSVLTDTGFPPSRIEVEITENSLVEDVDIARAILYSLKNQGMRVALDDFGTGYSSLVHLRDLPLDKIKIDKSFVSSLKNDIGSAKIVSAILGLVTSLGLPTVAEGIESEEVARILTDLGCSYGQGYLYSPPVPADNVPGLLHDSGERLAARAHARIA